MRSLLEPNPRMTSPPRQTVISQIAREMQRAFPTCPTMLGALEAFFSREQRLKTRGFFPGQRAGRWSTYDRETATSRPRAASQNCTDTPSVAVAAGQVTWQLGRAHV